MFGLMKLRSKLLSRVGRTHAARACRKLSVSWATAPLEPRLMLSGDVRSDGVVDFLFDNTRMSRLLVHGKNVLVAGGINLIGSTDGDDVPETNYESVGSKNGRMVAVQGSKPGPPFELHFTRRASNRVSFVASVGPVNQDFTTLDLAFNFDQKAIRTFEFGGDRLKYRNTGATDGWHDGSTVRFDDIPQHRAIRDASGRVRGYVGEAFTRNAPDMTLVKLSGPDVTVTIKIRRIDNVKEMAIANHFAAHAFGYNFGPLQRGESGRISGSITIEPR